MHYIHAVILVWYRLLDMAANTDGHELIVSTFRKRVPDEEEADPQSPKPNALHVSNEDSLSRSTINPEVRGNYYEGISGGDYARYINGTYNDLRPAAPAKVTCKHSRWQVPFICLGIALFIALVMWAHLLFKT